MINNNKNIPKLRFSEFKGEWENRKLSDFSIINPSSKKLPESFIYIDLESVEKGNLMKKNKIELINAPSRAQRFLQKNDIIFQTVRPYQKNNFYFNLDGIYVASTGYAQIRSDNNSKFLYQFLHTQKFVNKVIERCTGTSYPAINSTDLSKIKISFPTLPEQQKIATFLTAVDKKAEQLTRKKQLLEQYKKGIMQKIFSQQIRFKDKNGNNFPDWEEKRINKAKIQIIDGDRGVNYPKSSDFAKKGYCLFMNAKNVTKKGFSFKEKMFINKEKNEKLRNGKLIFNDLVLTTRGTVGNIAFYNKDIPFIHLRINSGMVILRINNNQICPKYIYIFISSDKVQNQILKISFGSAQPQLTVKEINNLIIKLPSLIEQEQIANFLSIIDKKIGHLDFQITKHQVFKKGLLQQMFV